ncbi:glycine oxidase ThiO [Marinococcus halophilus]|uniref:glycine oxidase n=1 Tax=Marinococcus halophilus TaxID=1371 RepID=A0A510Y2I9_MARHA|nr:glycine oxidase ThiO [Marinococcus halophilus]OZT81593.1 glycine oxidase ThiO [Marinococcus halophilus]GEK57538.1 glycine oxidase ThiO [Marinococcus halophilus]
MKVDTEVLIIGAGVQGCSLAYQLSRRGRRVMIIEKASIAAGASKAAAGMLGAQSEWEGSDLFQEFALESRAMFAELVPEVEALSGMDVSYVNNGMLKPVWNKTEAEKYQRLSGHSYGAKWLSARETRSKEPALSEHIHGAWSIPKDGQLRAYEWTLALARAAEANGTVIRENTAVDQLLEADGRVCGVKTSEGSIKADEVVFTGGSAGARLLDEREFSLYPVKGECLSVRLPDAALEHTLHTPEVYIVPKKDGEIFIGATEKPGDASTEVTVASMQKLMKAAVHLVPGLKHAGIERFWSGVRPQTGDGLPYMGRTSKGLWVMTGHYRNGILLSARSGSWMAARIEGESVREDWKQLFAVDPKIRKGGVIHANHA